jgi:hypothetical protein
MKNFILALGVSGGHYRSSSADEHWPCTRCQLQVGVRPLPPRACGPGSDKTKSRHDRFV